MSDPVVEISAKRKQWILSGVLVGMLLGSLTGTIISTAMPKILASLQGIEYIAWALTAYMLTSTLAMPVFGKLADMYGRKWFYIGGIAAFLVGSVLCGFSSDMTQFILARAFTGIGGGIMQALALTIVADLFPPAERGKYQGLIGAVFGISSIGGPLLGGWITDSLTWNWVFWVNLPIGLMALGILVLGLPAISRNPAPGIEKAARLSIDWFGVLFLILAFAPMLVAFSWGGTKYAWLSGEMIGLLSFSVVMLGIFVVVESRVREPVVPLTLFKSSIFNVSVITGFLLMIGMFSSITYLPMFLQGVVGENATNSGLVNVPSSIGLILASTLAGLLISKTGRYKVWGILSFMVMLAGEILLATINVDTDALTVTLYMVPIGFGFGLSQPVFVVASQSDFPHSQVGVVTATLQFFRSIGGTFGIALMGSMLNSQFKTQAATSLPESVTMLIPADKLDHFLTPQALFSSPAIEGFRNQVSALPGGTELAAKMTQAFRVAFTDSIHQVFLISVFIVGAGLIVTFFLKEIPFRKTHRPLAEEAGAELLAEGVAGPGPIPAEIEPDLHEDESVPKRPTIKD